MPLIEELRLIVFARALREEIYMPVIGNEVGLTLDQIVVATDFTPVSETAISHASALAKHCAAKLTVVNVVDLSVWALSEKAIVDIPIDEMRHGSEENVQRIVCDLATNGVKAQGKSLEGHNSASELLRFSEDVKTDLLVIGTHSKSGLEKMILGSFAENVIHHANCPVFTVGPHVKPPSGPGLTFGTIIFATDFHHSSLEKAAIALTFAKDSSAKIYMCHVLDHTPHNLIDSLDLQFKVEEELSRLIPATALEWCEPECLVDYGDVPGHILGLAQRVGASLIVLGARRSSTWRTHLTEGTVGRILSKSTCPVMTICTD